MTERMIRLKFEREHYPVSYGGPYHIRWEDTEPAPPKDWRPACYNYSELVEGCGQIPFTDKPECRECPYRKLGWTDEELGLE